MIDFIFIVLIISEITLTYYLINKIITIKKEVEIINNQILVITPEINKIHLFFQKTLHKINFVVSIINNKKINQIKNLIFTCFSVIEFIIIMRGFSLKKPINLKFIKKLFFTNITKSIFKQIFKLMVKKSCNFKC